jgi:O-Antigen ligase
MSLSIPGLIVWLCILLIGRMAGGALIIGLFASLPFGSTAFATLSSLGGSSPLIYTLFILGLICVVAARRTLIADLGAVFTLYKTVWLVCALAVYAAASAYVFPRLFLGETTAFIPIDGAITEVPLTPSSGNITQTAYFLLGVFLFIGLSVVLLRADNLKKVTSGFFAFVMAHALLGALDLASKMAGLGDLLLPIRTASYALLTEVEQSGFWRIVGGCAEASAYSGYALAALAFVFTYWRETNSRLAAFLTLGMLILVLLSTSSTAYVGLAGLAPFAALMIGRSAVDNQLRRTDVMLAVGILVILTAIIATDLYDSRIFRPFGNLIQDMVFNKATSDSGQERGYWNSRSLQTVVDTYGLGTGMGSSRSSSWAVSTISQLGIIGSVLVGLLLLVMMRGMIGLRPLPEDKPLFALCAGARACGFAGLLAASIAGGSADPGVLFFACLATIVACRHHVKVRQAALQNAPPAMSSMLAGGFA